jgi:glycosyltransferase involved in cell wall biosynthesis
MGPDTRKTILFVHNSNDLYGADIVLLNLLRGLDKTRFRTIVVLPRDVRHIDLLSKKLSADGIEFSFLPLGILRRKYLKPRRIAPYLFDLLRGILALCSLIRREKVDIVHSNTLTVLAGPVAARLCGRPHVWHIHEIVPDKGRARRVLHALAARLSTRVVTVSDAVRRHILEDQPQAASKIVTIHNGIDLAPFGPSDAERRRIREDLQVPADAVLIGMIGRVSRWKGQAVFADAAAETLRAGANVHFIAVGGVFDDERQFMDAFKEKVKSLGIDRFRICDFRQDVPALLASFDVFVLPSILPDPFPTVLIEAMASGLPVIASACGGVPEMVVAGQTGFLVPPGDASAFAKAMRQLAGDADLRNRMAAASRTHALAAFQLVRFVSEFENLYASLDAPRVIR